MIVNDIGTDSEREESVKQPQTEHVARPPRLSYRTAVRYNLQTECCVLNSPHFRSGPAVCQVVRLVYAVTNRASLSARRLSLELGTLWDSFCAALCVAHYLMILFSDTVSLLLDLYYLAFPTDRQP